MAYYNYARNHNQQYTQKLNIQQQKSIYKITTVNIHKQISFPHRDSNPRPPAVWHEGQVCYHSATQSSQFNVSFPEKPLKFVNFVATRGKIFSLKFTKYRLAAGLRLPSRNKGGLLLRGGEGRGGGREGKGEGGNLLQGVRGIDAPGCRARETSSRAPSQRAAAWWVYKHDLEPLAVTVVVTVCCNVTMPQCHTDTADRMSNTTWSTHCYRRQVKARL